MQKINIESQQQPPRILNDQISKDNEQLKMFLTVFGGEVLTAFERASVTKGGKMVRNITNGKAAQFPVIGRTSARYLKQGESLDDGRMVIPNTEVNVEVDGLLVADAVIKDIDAVAADFEYTNYYSSIIGEALAYGHEASIMAEMAKLVNTRATAKDENIEGLGRAGVIAMPVMDSTKAGYLKAYGDNVLQGLTRARSYLVSNHADPKECVVYLEPIAYSAVLTALNPNAAAWEALADLEKGVVVNYIGFEIRETNLMVTPSSTLIDNPEDAFNGEGHVFPVTGDSSTAGKMTIGNDNAIALICHRSAVGEVKLKEISLERDYDVEVGTRLIAKMAVGAKGLRPEGIVALISKADATTVFEDVPVVEAPARNGKIVQGVRRAKATRID